MQISSSQNRCTWAGRHQEQRRGNRQRDGVEYRVHGFELDVRRTAIDGERFPI